MSEIIVKVEIPGLENLIHALEAIAGNRNAQTPMQQQPVVQQQIPVQTQPLTQQIPVQQQVPMQQTMVPQMPVQQTTMQVPTTAVAQEFTQDQLAVASAGLVNQGKQARLIEILRQFGVNTLVELPKERYGEFAVALRAEGAVI